MHQKNIFVHFHTLSSIKKHTLAWLICKKLADGIGILSIKSKHKPTLTPKQKKTR